MTLSPDVALFGQLRNDRIDDDLAAGVVSLHVREGALRRVRVGDAEVLRGVEFVVRDRFWRTLPPRVERFRRHVTAEAIEAEWAIRFLGPECDLAVSLRAVVGQREFLLSAKAVSGGETWTNRAGLVLLYPASIYAGRRARAIDPNGRMVPGRLPSAIAAHVPFTDIATLEIDAEDRTRIIARFEGDTFEMEDQRNWSDPSFKIYSRPLRFPAPYRIAPGGTVEQTIRVEIEGQYEGRRRRNLAPVAVRATLRPNDEIGRMPSIGLGVHPDRARCDDAELDLLRDLGPALLCLAAPSDVSEDAIATFARLVRGAGCMAAAEITVKSGAEDCDSAFAAVAARLVRAGLATAAVSVHPTTRETTASARRAFRFARIGGGTRLFFANVNREALPAELDFVRWTISSGVHDVADAAVMETLECLPAMLALARTRWPGTPIWVGPNTLRPRFRPLTEGVQLSPLDLDGRPDDVDPRQRGLFAAAWTAGFVSQLASEGVDTILMFEPFGDRGVIGPPAAVTPPLAAKRAQAVAFPVYLVLRALMSARGAPLLRLDIDRREEIHGVAWGGSRPTALFANTTPETRSLQLENFGRARCWKLDGETVLRSITEQEPLDWQAEEVATGTITLPSYAVLRVRLNG